MNGGGADPVFKFLKESKVRGCGTHTHTRQHHSSSQCYKWVHMHAKEQRHHDVLPVCFAAMLVQGGLLGNDIKWNFS